MSSAYDVYQGGLPSLSGRRRGGGQRGSGFFSTIKRFLFPIAKKLIPHAAGAVSDLASGKSFKDTLKSRAANAGADVIEAAASSGADAIRQLGSGGGGGAAGGAGSMTSSSSTTKRQPEKKYKRPLTAPKRLNTAKRSRSSNWQ